VHCVSRPIRVKERGAQALAQVTGLDVKLCEVPLRIVAQGAGAVAKHSSSTNACFSADRDLAGSVGLDPFHCTAVLPHPSVQTCRLRVGSLVRSACQLQSPLALYQRESSIKSLQVGGLEGQGAGARIPSGRHAGPGASGCASHQLHTTARTGCTKDQRARGVVLSKSVSQPYRVNLPGNATCGQVPTSEQAGVARPQGPAKLIGGGSAVGIGGQQDGDPGTGLPFQAAPGRSAQLVGPVSQYWRAAHIGFVADLGAVAWVPGEHGSRSLLVSHQSGSVSGIPVSGSYIRGGAGIIVQALVACGTNPRRAQFCMGFLVDENRVTGLAFQVVGDQIGAGEAQGGTAVGDDTPAVMVGNDRERERCVGPALGFHALLRVNDQVGFQLGTAGAMQAHIEIRAAGQEVPLDKRLGAFVNKDVADNAADHGVANDADVGAAIDNGNTLVDATLHQ
jgi:hypothetical protein